MMSDISRLQEEVGEWSKKNFPNSETWMPLMGAVEELGELAHAHLKNKQQIRAVENEQYKAMAMDAIGDIVIYLTHYCERTGLDLETCIFGTWDEVKKRDWRARPHSG